MQSEFGLDLDSLPRRVIAGTVEDRYGRIAVPLERCCWVVENLLLAGAYPGHPNNHAHTKRVSGLWEAGMRTFINLMEEDETNHSGLAFVRYDDVLRELALKNSDQIAHLRFPIPDQKITTVDRMRSILDAIDLSFGKKEDLRGKLKIGLQWDPQVTLAGCEHLVTQAYCSALPVV